MEIVGEKWKTYEYFIPNVLVSAMATKLSLNTLQPALITLKPPSGKGGGRNGEGGCP